MHGLIEDIIDVLITVGVVALSILLMIGGLAWFAATWATLFNAFGL